MQNLKKINGIQSLNRKQLKEIKGGVNACVSNSQCSTGRCCINGGCIRTSNSCVGL